MRLPAQPRLADLLNFQRHIQTDKLLEPRHHSTLAFLAQLWYLQIKALALKNNNTTFSERQASFDECIHLRQQVERVREEHIFDDAVEQEVWLARILFDQMVVDFDEAARANPKKTLEVYEDLGKHCNALAEKQQSLPERYKYLFMRNSYWAVTHNKQDVRKLEESFRTEYEKDDQLSEGARLSVQLYRLISSVWFYIHAGFRCDLLGSDPHSKTMEPLFSFNDLQYGIQLQVASLRQAAIEVFPNDKSEGLLPHHLEVQQLVERCHFLEGALAAQSCRKEEAQLRKAQLLLLKEVASTLDVVIMYLEPERRHDPSPSGAA